MTHRYLSGATRLLAITGTTGLLLGLPLGLSAKPKIQEIKGVSIGGIVITDAPREGGPNKYGYNPVEGVTCTVSSDKITQQDREKDLKEKDPDKKKYECITDDKGFFHFNALPKGEYTVTFNKEGYPSQTKSAHVVEGEVMGDNLRVTMNPKGFSAVDGTPTGPGTVYVAFSERQLSAVRNGEGGTGMLLNNRNTMIQAVAAGADPLTLGGNAPVTSDSKDLEQNGISTDPNTLMIYPPGSPGRTGYSKMAVRPFWVCFNRSGSTLYISSAAQMVQVLDAAHGNRLLQNVPTQGPVTDLSPSLDGRYILASVIGNNAIMLLDATTNYPTNLLPCALPPRASAMSGDRVFVVEGDSATGQVQVLNGTTGVSLGITKVGANPTGVAVTPDGRKIFVVNSGAASVSVLDALTMAEVTRIGVGVNPLKVAVSPDGRHAYVTNKGSDSVSIIDTQALAVTCTAGVGKGPIGLAVSRDNKHVFVGCKDAGTVVMLDGESGQLLHTTLPQPNSSPYGIAIRP